MLSIINILLRPIFLEKSSFCMACLFCLSSGWVVQTMTYTKFFIKYNFYYWDIHKEPALKFIQHLMTSHMYTMYLIISTPNFLWTYFLPNSYLFLIIIINLVFSNYTWVYTCPMQHWHPTKGPQPWRRQTLPALTAITCLQHPS